MNDDELAKALEGGNPDGGRDGGPGGDPTGGPAEDLRALLADETVWAVPDPAGLDALLASIAAEPRPAPEPGGEPPVPSPTPSPPADAPAVAGPVVAGPGRPAHARRDRPRRGLALAAAAALVVAAGVAGALVVTRDGGDAGREVAVAGTELAPGASATARVEETGSGVAITLDVRDLPPAEPGTYYQGWVRGPDGAVTIGTFHVREGDDEVELWAGVELDDYPTLTVTLQQEGAGAESSGQVVLTAEIG